MVQLTRKVRFSALHRFHLAELSAEENAARFGRAAIPHGHGHDYLVEVSVGGEINPLHGMVVNISDLKPILQSEIVEQLDGALLSSEHPLLEGKLPGVEVITPLIWRRIEAAIRAAELPAALQCVSLTQSRRSRAECHPGEGQPMVTLTRTYEFAAAHRLDSANLDAEANKELFGKCNNPAGHGHNYVLEVTVGGEPDPRTGLLPAREALDRVVDAEVVDRYDHRHLNYDIPEFRDLIPTSENLVRVIWSRLEPALPQGALKRVTVRETDRNSFTYEGEGE